MYKIPAKTLFTGKNLIFVPECNSTNTLAQQLCQQPAIPDGTLVITDNQTSGRGQRGNSWEGTAGQNFTMSLILKSALLVQDQFLLNIALSVGVTHYLKSRTNNSVQIKWPNDILIEQKKVCGILIENSLQGGSISHSIAGIGLNMNQETFESPRASSLKMFTGKNYSLPDELEDLLIQIEKFYLQLRQRNIQTLLDEYYQNLFWLGEEKKFRVAGSDMPGTITGIDHAGRLKVQMGKGERFFGMKEIEFLY